MTTTLNPAQDILPYDRATVNAKQDEIYSALRELLQIQFSVQASLNALDHVKYLNFYGEDGLLKMIFVNMDEKKAAKALFPKKTDKRVVRQTVANLRTAVNEGIKFLLPSVPVKNNVPDLAPGFFM